MALFLVDCEAWGRCPRKGQLTEFGAVEYKSLKSFHGILVPSRPSAENPAIPEPTGPADPLKTLQVMTDFKAWLLSFNGRPIMVSDNPAYDYQWIADAFECSIGENPFGHSARRISDFYAGLTGDFYNTQKWKRLRVTPHDHNPVNDAMGNAEALRRMIAGER